MTEQVDEDKVHDKETPATQLLYQLSKPILAYGEKITQLKMREPNGEDLIAVGNPVIFFPHANPVRIEHDLQKVIAMVARLTTEPKVPTSSLVKMDPSDITGLAWAISPFFTPAR